MPKKKVRRRTRRAQKKITKEDIAELKLKIERMEELISGLRTRIGEAKAALEEAKKECQEEKGDKDV